MEGLFLFFPLGILGISYLYWAILATFIALTTFFIKIPPFALPRNPSLWIVKKYILQYFHSGAWLLTAWVFYRVHRNDGEFTFWLGLWVVVACLLLITFLIVWGWDRYQIKKMKDSNRYSNS